MSTKAGVTSSGGSIPDLFADDAQVYFPSCGVTTGKRVFSYLDPDYAGQDTACYPWLSDTPRKKCSKPAGLMISIILAGTGPAFHIACISPVAS